MLLQLFDTTGELQARDFLIATPQAGGFLEALTEK